jgi:hypothetical protein
MHKKSISITLFTSDEPPAYLPTQRVLTLRQQAVPTIHLPEDEKLDLLDLATACASELSSLIKCLANRSPSPSIETIEPILALRNCLSRLHDWNINLIGCENLLQPAGKLSGLMGRIAQTLLRLMVKLVHLDELLAAGTGTNSPMTLIIEIADCIHSPSSHADPW